MIFGHNCFEFHQTKGVVGDPLASSAKLEAQTKSSTRKFRLLVFITSYPSLNTHAADTLWTGDGGLKSGLQT